MSVCYIVGAGDCRETLSPAAGDFVIAADGGQAHLSRMGVLPDLILGDFDSSAAPPSGDIVRFSPIKDDTDMALAVRAGAERGYRRFCLLGGMGGTRTDHTVANFQLLLSCAAQGLAAELVGAGERARVLRNGRMTFPATATGYLSVFAVGGAAHGVTLRGLAYPLENGTLTPDCPLGVSNAFLPGTPAAVSVSDGALLLIFRAPFGGRADEFSPVPPADRADDTAPVPGARKE